MNDAINVADVKTRAPRGVKCARIFRLKSGEPSSRSSAEVQSVVFTFPSHVPDPELVMNLDDLKPGVLRAAAAFGINTSVGNTFGGIEDPIEAAEAARNRWEALCEGEWSADKGSGPRVGELVEALRSALKKAGGNPDAAWEDGLRNRIASGETTREKLLANPAVKAEYDTLRLQKLQERIKAAQEKAAASPASSLTDL